MGVSDLVVLIGAVGGAQGIIEAVKWWRVRKVHDRSDMADVVSKESDNNRKQIEWLEKRIGERDLKIDALYAELREEQAAKLETIHQLHEVELKLAEAEVKKCHKRGCRDRIPPSDY